MHHGDNLDDIESYPIDYPVGKMCHPALADVALHKAVGLGMAAMTAALIATLRVAR
ncbi:MAG: hypothetical protein WB402_00060 [Sulfuricaulis sp.]